ncbi:MAG TPA: methionyl-tRNA formyltransferase [Candidatus Polarisedimenticolia bacterium]|nr:methionyl-tRNA formyltransferase [Candidatus Polarisedimenticolia bacterium]
MRLVFMGTPDFAVPSLVALLEAGHQVLAALTQPDRPRRRRGGRPEPSPVKATAQLHGLEVLQPVRVAEPAIADRLTALAPDTIVVVAYGQILPDAILKIPPRWCINLHASILPRYRGAAPVARAIMEGEKVTGMTTMKMDHGLDTGDILLQKECAIGLTETAGELAARMAGLGAALLVETLERHAEGRLEPRRQDDRQATTAPPLRREDGHIDWSVPAELVSTRVRACNPWPLAHSLLRGTPVKILRAEPSFEPVPKLPGSGTPGRIVGCDDRRVLVTCKGGSLLAISEIRFPGGRAISARDAVHGRLIRVGEIFAPAPSA